MDWNDVPIFLAIARSGSLGGAGRALGIAQPTVGRRLSALEAALGQRLFQRSHTGLVLTDEGQAVLAAAERMEEEALAFRRRLGGTAQALSGVLRITASDWFGSYVLTPALCSFSRSHPGVEIELMTDARLYDLSRREADLAFRITAFTAPDIVTRRFLTLDYGLFRARDREEFERAPDSVRLITLDNTLAHFPDTLWLQTRYPEAPVMFRSNSREAQARACAAGLGLAVLPLRLAAHFPDLVAIATDSPPPARETWLGYHKDLRQLGRLRALLEHLDRECGNAG